MSVSVVAPQSIGRSVQCPFCSALPGDPCVTPVGRERDPHQARTDAVSRRYRSHPSVVAIREDQPQFGLAAGDQYFALPYWLDPAKVTLKGRLTDLHDPNCNQYRHEVLWLRWATPAEVSTLHQRPQHLHS